MITNFKAISFFSLVLMGMNYSTICLLLGYQKFMKFHLLVSNQLAVECEQR